MRIDFKPDTGAIGNMHFSPSQATGSEHKDKDLVGVRGTVGDQANVSNATTLVAQAKAVIPADKHEKVSMLTAQYQAGQYSIDGLQLSRAILSNGVKS